MKYSICNEIFEGWDLGKSFGFVKEIGYDGVELAPFTICDDVSKVGKDERLKIREQANKLGLEIVGLHWIFIKPEGLHLNSPDRAVRERTRDYMYELIDFIHDLGGKVMVIGSPGQRRVVGSYEEAWELAVDFFRDCVLVAAAKGVILCFEPLRKEINNFVTTAEEAVKFVKEVNHPNFRLILDVYSMCGESRPVWELVEDYGKYLAHFHANDDNKRGPGLGGVDYKKLAAALRKVNYGGYVSVEVFDVYPGAEAVARASLRYLKGVFGNMY